MKDEGGRRKRDNTLAGRQCPHSPAATAKPFVVQPPTLNATFVYDLLNRLTSVTYSDGQGV